MLRITDESGRTYPAHPLRTKGKTTVITAHGAKISNPTAITVLGHQDPTNSERARELFLLQILQGVKSLKSFPLLQLLWLNSESHPNIETQFPFDEGNLNQSQKKVVSAMLGESDITIVHGISSIPNIYTDFFSDRSIGPPGTGKTTAIAQASRFWAKVKEDVWIVAHSNVAVKNIAEKLLKNDIDFKIIVSKEFYVEW